jgi:polyribonucleotide nucleotidyltransferase
MSALVNGSEIADIVVHYVFPPFGSQEFSYTARREGNSEMIGRGTNPELAIEDLLQREHEEGI